MKRVRSTRSAVEAVGDRIEFVLAVDREVGAFGQVLTQQSVGILAGAALPRTVWIAEVDLHAGGGTEILMTGHFLALVIGEALAQGCSDRVQLGSEARQCRAGGAVFHVRHTHPPAGPLNTHAD